MVIDGLRMPIPAIVTQLRREIPMEFHFLLDGLLTFHDELGLPDHPVSRSKDVFAVNWGSWFVDCEDLL